MNNRQKFFICEQCGNLIGLIDNHEVPLNCCGASMKELIPNITDAAVEKHLPVATFDGKLLHAEVGSTLHPMEEAHHLTFLYVETTQGGQRKNLSINQEPKATFSFTDDKPLAVYVYCNLHGLWKTEI